MLHGHFEQTEARWQTFGGAWPPAMRRPRTCPAPYNCLKFCFPQLMDEESNSNFRIAGFRASTLLREAELVDNLR